ncbi:MAG: hypothetical protein PHU99_10470, partial [Candidatus Cloacimonetes bacterium]|nr:hypothetical protein [Candidatus Cloacimonadota bacterium]
PMMPAPQKRYDVNEDVQRLEEKAKEVAESEEVGTASDRTGKVITLEDLMKEEEGDLAGTVSFKEIQKIIGIER